jgi:hypothetical protein
LLKKPTSTKAKQAMEKLHRPNTKTKDKTPLVPKNLPKKLTTNHPTARLNKMREYTGADSIDQNYH